MTHAADEFWLDAVRKCGSNGATDGFGTLEALIQSGRLNSSQLRSLHGALRSLSQLAWDAAALNDLRTKRPFEFREQTPARRACNAQIPDSKNLCTRDAGHPGEHRCLGIDVDNRKRSA